MALGDLEREIMTQLWAAGEPLTVRQVHERLSRDRELAYTTVMTVLDRLAKKDVVTQEKTDRAYRYAPARTREQVTALLLGACGLVLSLVVPGLLVRARWTDRAPAAAVVLWQAVTLAGVLSALGVVLAGPEELVRAAGSGRPVASVALIGALLL